MWPLLGSADPEPIGRGFASQNQVAFLSLKKNRARPFFTSYAGPIHLGPVFAAYVQYADPAAFEQNGDMVPGNLGRIAILDFKMVVEKGVVAFPSDFKGKGFDDEGVGRHRCPGLGG